MSIAKTLFMASLASVLVACSQRPTSVEVISEPVREELYIVSGSSIQDVIASINAQLMGGFAAYAGVNIYYELQTNSSLFGSCTLKSIKVTVKPYTKIPAWKSSGSFEATMLPNWLQYITALRLHEDGHVELGLAAAASFAERFSYPNIVKASDCTALEQLVRSIFDTDIAKLQQDNRDYDKITGHGRTQGTNFSWN